MTTITYYTVNIAYMAITGATLPGTGFIDNTRPDHYGTATISPIPSSLDAALDKGRAYVRWIEIINQIGMNISPMVSNVTATGADPSTAATSFSFTAGYDRNDYVNTLDELNPGNILYGVDAVKRWVARALTSAFFTKTVIVDPTPIWNIPHTAPSGEKTVDIVAGPIANTISAAESNITVTLITNI